MNSLRLNLRGLDDEEDAMSPFARLYLELALKLPGWFLGFHAVD